MSQPLEGIRVVDLGQIYAAPYCTLQLAHLGAEVLKIETPGTGEQLRRFDRGAGDTSYVFLMLNANKKSVTLNLKHRRGQELLMRLLEDADVLVENYTADVVAALGVGYEKLAARFPRLIYASIKGYGADGPWARLGALDSTLQAGAGLMSVTGMPEGPPIRTPATMIDMGVGSYLLSGILAALIQRGRTGRGQKVEATMFDAVIPSLTGIIANHLERRGFTRTGNRHRAAAPSNVYPAADGEILIFCVSEAHWRDFARLMERADLLEEPRFRSHGARLKIVEEVDALVGQWTRRYTRAELTEMLIEHGIPCAPVRTVPEVMADSEVAQRQMLPRSYFAERGEIQVLGTPIKLAEGGFDAAQMKPPPELGQHTAQVLGRIGVGAAELEELRQAGVV